jgi:hypothetical protein
VTEDAKRLFYAFLISVILLVVVIFPVYVLRIPFVSSVPKQLRIGDSWTYQVIFPDGESYELTESVKDTVQLNGTETYLLLRDDPQHASTEYLWITPDWREIKTFQPSIGNMVANSSVTYSPPIELLQIPLRVGDKWIVNSTVTTITQLKNSKIQAITRLVEKREFEKIDEISTPAGSFRAFKVIVTMNGAPIEITWFDTSLGQIVRGEYYNGLEVVTQSLVSYSETFPATSTFTMALYQTVNRARRHFGSYIYKIVRTFTELKMSYD